MKNTILLLLNAGITGLLVAALTTLQAQPTNYPLYRELPGDPYIPVARAARRTAPPYQRSGTHFSIRQVNTNDQGQNILGDAANEPSIAIDPTNPLRMAIGWRQFDTIASNFRQAGNAYSNDGGQTWIAPEPIEAGVFRSDPVLDADRDGNIHYNSLSTAGGFSCTVFRSSADNNWDAGTFAYGGDKQWMVIDRTTGGAGNFYESWSAGISNCDGGFTRSTDQGLSYENCSSIPENPAWGTLAVGPDGELYAAGVVGAGILIARSVNAGQPIGTLEWDFNTVLDPAGYIGNFDGPNPAGLLGQIWIQVDQSSGPSRGYVYLLWTVVNAVTLDPADVMFARSTDGGLTWSAPLRLNDDVSNTNYQWFGTLSVAPNGRIDVIWLDTRDNPGTYLSRLYYTYSLDGGISWSPDEALSDSFDPHQGWPNQNKMGDYFHMLSDGEAAHLAWAATFGGEQNVYYSRIVPDVPLAAHENGTAAAVSQIAPNPFVDQTIIRYTLRQKAELRIAISDVFGNTVKILQHGEAGAGEHFAVWDGADNQGRPVVAGIYFCTLQLENPAVRIVHRVVRSADSH